MYTFIEEIYQSKKFVSIYVNDQDTGKFIYGRICGCDNKNFAMVLIDPEGYYDGIIVKAIDTIIRIEIDSQYSFMMNEMCKENDFIQDIPNLEGDNLYVSLLLLSKQTKKIVSIELLDSGYDDIIGIVDSVDGNVFKIDQVDSEGRSDGYSYVLIKNISQISYDEQQYQLGNTGDDSVSSDEK